MAVGALYTYQTTSIIKWLCEALKRISSLAPHVDGEPERVSDIIKWSLKLLNKVNEGANSMRLNTQL